MQKQQQPLIPPQLLPTPTIVPIKLDPLLSPLSPCPARPRSLAKICQSRSPSIDATRRPDKWLHALAHTHTLRDGHATARSGETRNSSGPHRTAARAASAREDSLPAPATSCKCSLARSLARSSLAYASNIARPTQSDCKFVTRTRPAGWPMAAAISEAAAALLRACARVRDCAAVQNVIGPMARRRNTCWRLANNCR